MNDPFLKQEFSEKNRFPYPVLSDYRRDVIKQWGLELHNFTVLKGYTVPNRSIFVLDQQDILGHFWVSEDSSFEPNTTKYRRL